MYSSTERDASMMKLVVTVKPRSRKKELLDYPFSQVNMDTVATDCVDIFTHYGRRLFRTYKGGKIITYLRDAKIHSDGSAKYLMLLLAVSDKRRPDEVLSDPKTESRREIRKAETEGSEYSCHVVIRLTPDILGGNHYTMAFEVVPSFGATYVHWYLRYLFRLISTDKHYNKPDPSGARIGKSGSTVPIVLATEVHAVPSDQLLIDLRNGEIAEIELSREVVGIQGFDQASFTREKRSSLLLVPTQKDFSGKVLDAITGVCMTGKKKHFQVAKVKWRSEHGQSLSADFDCDSASVISDRYVKKHTFDLTSPMLASCNEIEPGFSARLAAWIK